LIEKYAVLGSPIGHSLSPAIHSAAFQLLGRYARYELVDTTDLASWFPKSAHEYSGLSLTMPLKEQAFDFADRVDEVARVTRSINTMIQSDVGWQAFNTDPAGISYAISTNSRFTAAQSVTILGSGATARSAAYSLSRSGKAVAVWGRNGSTAIEVAALANGTVINDFATAIESEFVVSTLPMGVLAGLLPKSFTSSGVLLDVGYRPWPTEAAEHWLERGEAISGLQMLIGQAVVAQRIFNYGDLDRELPDEPALLRAMQSAALPE
jgi:shikimate dehydrogenase